MGLNTKYPREAEHVWEFVQKGIYNINTAYDRNFNSVLNLIHDLKKKR